MKYKRRNNYSRNDQPSTNSRTYTNSNSNMMENRNVQQRRPTTADINGTSDKHYENHQNKILISDQALNYAASTYLQSIKLVCDPKMKEQKEAAKFYSTVFQIYQKGLSPTEYHLQKS
jgi:hypothetical protein